jgi:hypothetical protein
VLSRVSGVPRGLEGAADIGVYRVVAVGYRVAVAELVNNLRIVRTDVLQQLVGAALVAAARCNRGADVPGAQGFLVVCPGDILPLDVLQVVGVELRAYAVKHQITVV